MLNELSRKSFSAFLKHLFRWEGKSEVLNVINSASSYEEVWGSGETVPYVLNVDTVKVKCSIVVTFSAL
jgi:hypothetical protein